MMLTSSWSTGRREDTGSRILILEERFMWEEIMWLWGTSRMTRRLRQTFTRRTGEDGLEQEILESLTKMES